MHLSHLLHPQKRALPPSSEDCLFLKYIFPDIAIARMDTRIDVVLALPPLSLETVAFQLLSGFMGLPFESLHGRVVFEITFRGSYMAGSAFAFPPDDLIYDANGGVVAVVIQY